MLQSSQYDGPNNSSVMNLSDLIMHNNPALQNLLQGEYRGRPQDSGFAAN